MILDKIFIIIKFPIISVYTLYNCLNRAKHDETPYFNHSQILIHSKQSVFFVGGYVYLKCSVCRSEVLIL